MGIGMPRSTRVGTDLHCHGIGVGGKFKIEVVLHELLELDTEKPSLRQHAAPLLDEIAEIFSESRVRDDHSLPEESCPVSYRLR